MLLSFLVYLSVAVTGLGLVSMLLPLRFLGIRNRGIAVVVVLAGMIAASTVMNWPTDEVSVVNGTAAIDEFAPVFQFHEGHEIPIRANAGQVYSALLTVSADEIPLYRTLVWIRRGGAEGPESILNPPDGVPLFTVATRTSFVTLATTPGVEHVIGTVVLAPRGVRLALGSTPESFKALLQPGFAKATIGFRIEPRPDGWTVLRTETRVDGTDEASRATFARYWRVIAPGSGLIRLMWLRAVKVRAETIASAPVVPAADWEWIDRLGRERRPKPVPVEEESPVRLRR
jgi:hypothetical protein